MKSGDLIGLNQYETLSANIAFERAVINTSVFDRATELRANFKLGDAIHLAADIVHDCDPSLTENNRLTHSIAIAVEVLV